MNILQKYITRNPCYQANVKVLDSRYRIFQERGPLGLMLHSVGCAQPSAESFWRRWNNENYNIASVQAVIDANTGDIWQCMPWNYRAWHCGGDANNTHVGVEMCESKWISYTGHLAEFNIIDRTKAVEDCVRTYKAAVELFAFLCLEYKLNPLTDIISHKEGGKKGIASGHVDPEHYWTGLGMNYTMDTFRAAVQKQIKKMKKENVLYMTEAELKALVNSTVNEAVDEKLSGLPHIYTKNELETLIATRLSDRLGQRIGDVSEIRTAGIRGRMQNLLDADVINGGTPKDENPNDINMDYELIRVLAICTLYSEQVVKKAIAELQAKEE